MYKRQGGSRRDILIGEKALADYKCRFENTQKISALLSVKPEQTAEAAQKLLQTVADLKQELGALKLRLLEEKVDAVETGSSACVLFEQGPVSYTHLDVYKRQTYSPIAGAEERPGDSIPAQSKKPGASSASPITKSPPASEARRPANEVIVRLPGRDGTLSRPFSITSASPAWVVLTASLSERFSAVGPTNRFPWTVGLTKMPLPIFPGS